MPSLLTCQKPTWSLIIKIMTSVYMTSYVMNMTMTLVWYDTWQLVSAACWTTDDWSVWVFISSTGTGVCPPVSGHTSTSTQTSYCKTHICTLTPLRGSSLQTLNIYTDIWYTDSGWWTQSTSWWTFLWFLWFWSRGWAMLTFKSHAIVYEWIKHILYSAYNCANACQEAAPSVGSIIMVQMGGCCLFRGALRKVWTLSIAESGVKHGWQFWNIDNRQVCFLIR